MLNGSRGRDKARSRCEAGYPGMAPQAVDVNHHYKSDKIARILARLNEAVTVQDMALPGYRLHPLKGELAGFWSVTVPGNWRIVF